MRVQSSPGAQPGVCVQNQNTSSSSVALAPIESDGRIGVFNQSSIVFSLLGDDAFELSAEDPRCVLNNRTYIMTYTAHASGATSWPKSLRQSIATTRAPLVPSSWIRHCTPTTCGLREWGYKSGAMIVRDSPPHYMLLYNLSIGSEVDPDHGRLGARGIVMATSEDLLHWQLTGQAVLPTRNASWDRGLVEPGPPPLRLADGNHFFVYNSATFPWDKYYHVGWVILRGDDPAVVVQRSDSPLLLFEDEPFEVSNSSRFLCNVGNVVFVTGMR